MVVIARFIRCAVPVPIAFTAFPIWAPATEAVIVAGAILSVCKLCHTLVVLARLIRSCALVVQNTLATDKIPASAAEAVTLPNASFSILTSFGHTWVDHFFTAGSTDLQGVRVIGHAAAARLCAIA